MSDLILQKRGEEVLRTTFRRTKGGVRFTVKIHPTVEELMKQWGDGESCSVREFGANWARFDPTTDLKIWYLNRKFENVSLGSYAFTISHPGLPLFMPRREYGANQDVFNFSFIRLVGASEGDGVSFDLKGAFSLELLKSFNEKIKECGRRFYSDYLLPVDMTVSVITQEWKP